MDLFKSKENKPSLDKIIKNTEMLLREQIDGAKGNSNWQKNFGSKFALGYIWALSFKIIKENTKDEVELALGIEKVFNNLFNDEGFNLLATAKQYSNNPDFSNGVKTAEQDLIGWVNNNGDMPHSLLDYLNKSMPDEPKAL